MDLREYLNQTEISKTRVGEVELSITDVKFGKTINNGREILRVVYVIGIYAEYILKGTSRVLYTTDKDGNPKNLSVFQIR